MIDFLLDNLLLLPFLFPAYLVLEWVEAHAGDALERKLGRVSHWGPLFGSLVGVVPQCGFSAAAASLYAGGVITVGTLLAVFLSTSDELIPILLSKQIPIALIAQITLIKVMFALLIGLGVNVFLYCIGRRGPSPHVGELCAHSRCSCEKHHGIVRPALIHTLEVFFFLLIISGAVELVMAFCGGEEALKASWLKVPILGELLGGLIGLIPNCAASVACAEMYAEGAMSLGALLASSLTGAGVGLLVLFRTHRHQLQNLGILLTLYLSGVLVSCCVGHWL